MSGVIEPLLAFRGRWEALIRPVRLVAFAGSVAAEVAAKYGTLVADLLGTVQKTEDSLKRLRRLRPSASTSTDGDNIRRQLRLDVEEFERQLKAKVFVTPAAVDSSEPLQDLLRQIRAADAP